MKLKLTSFVFFLCILIFLSSSFDVFLNLKLGGFSLRLSVGIMILLSIIYVIYQASTNLKKPVRFLGVIYFIIWFLFLTAFIPNTTILSRSIGYIAWLGIFAGFVMVLPAFFEKEEEYIRLVKWYLFSFLFVAIFGLAQFSLGMIGIDILIEQWWLDYALPRINAFSYEPSYFSTYELIAWVICFFLIIYKSELVKKFKIKFILFVITASLLLSTSRMGLIFIFGIIFIYTFNQLKNTFVTFKLKRKTLPIFLTFMTFLVVFIGGVAYFFKKIEFMLHGMGIMGHAGHSSEQRTSEFLDTLEAFWNSPIIGYSLGGIAPAIANVRNTSIHTQLEAKDFEGMSIFAETLAASGLIGFLFFIAFLWVLFSKTYRLIKELKPINKEFSDLLLAMLAALLVVLLILNMNQNILRVYLWVHIAMVNLGYFIGKRIVNEARIRQV